MRQSSPTANQMVDPNCVLLVLRSCPWLQLRGVCFLALQSHIVWGHKLDTLPSQAKCAVNLTHLEHEAGGCLNYRR